MIPKWTQDMARLLTLLINLNGSKSPKSKNLPNPLLLEVVKIYWGWLL
jgi:hypothetical protein